MLSTDWNNLSHTDVYPSRRDYHTPKYIHVETTEENHGVQW